MDPAMGRDGLDRIKAAVEARGISARAAMPSCKTAAEPSIPRENLCLFLSFISHCGSQLRFGSTWLTCSYNLLNFY